MSITWIVEPRPEIWTCCTKELKCRNGHVLGTIPYSAYYSYSCEKCKDWDQIASRGWHKPECQIAIDSDRYDAVALVKHFWLTLRELRAPSPESGLAFRRIFSLPEGKE